MLFYPLNFPCHKIRILLLTTLFFLKCKVMVAVRKKINLLKPNSLSLGALEVMVDRTGDPVCYSLPVKVLESPQYMRSPYSRFTENIAVIPDQCITMAFSDEVPGCPGTSRK